MKRAAGAIALLVLALMMLAPLLAHAVSATWPITVSAPSNVSLDSTIFTGTQQGTLNGGDTIVANITGCTGPSDCTVGGADFAKFKVVAAGGVGPGGWTNSANGGPRRGPFLMSSGNQSGCTTAGDGCHITLNGTPFVIGDPPAPSLGTVTALSPGGNVQSALNSVGSGNTVFLNCGTYNTGGLNVPSGVRLVSATAPNHLRGQTCRATVDLGGGQISVNGIAYGLNITNGGDNTVTGNGQLINNNVAFASNNNTGRLTCQSNGADTEWNSFSYGYGVIQGCDILQWTFRKNFVFQSGGESLDGPYGCFGTTATFVASDNFFNMNNAGEGSQRNTLGSIIEWGLCGITEADVNNNYVLNAGSGGSGGCCGGYAFSLINQTVCPVNFKYNYIGGHQTFVEWSPHIGNSTGPSCHHIEDNYLDWQNIPDNSQYSNQGIGNTGGDCVSPSTVLRNREIPNTADFCLPPGYIAGSNTNIGIPAPFATGASS